MKKPVMVSFYVKKNFSVCPELTIQCVLKLFSEEANIEMEFIQHKKDYYMNKLDYSKVTE